MRFTKYLILTIFLAYSCQGDKLIEEDLIGEWIYERELSSTFSNLLDRDIAGKIILSSEGTGSWDSDLILVGPVSLDVSFDLVWQFDENKKQVELIKTSTSSSAETLRTYTVQKLTANRINLIYENKIVNNFETINIIDEFENIFLTRN